MFLLHFTWFSFVIFLISYVKNLVAKICYTIVFHSENEAVVVVATEAFRTNGSTQNIYVYLYMYASHAHICTSARVYYDMYACAFVPMYACW